MKIKKLTNKSWPFKVMQISIVFLVMACCVNIRQNINSTFEIDFQDFFKRDTVSIKVGGQLVLKNKIINSDFSTGLTDLSLKVYIKENYVIVEIEDNKIRINDIAIPFTLDIYLNGNLNRYSLDENKGKYIGFNKNSKTTFEFYQQDEPFEYD
ncbi:hypothetical protein E0494_02490 [Marinilabiliaceae bacterium JC040]|nr:hypothetical protein [Marinilabiliaceae bacterium JC040]